MAFLFAIALQVNGQQRFDYLSRSNNIPLERHIHRLEVDLHTAFKPYNMETFERKINLDSIASAAIQFRYRNKTSYGKFMRKLRFESLLKVDTTDFILTVDPLLHVQQGRQRETDSLLFMNTRGFAVHGKIGQKVRFYSDFRENQAKFPDFIDAYIRKQRVVPGHGAVKLFKGSGFDFAMASGYVSYAPSGHFHFRFGHGKNFIGDGYRSLLLSDASFNYPFLRITTEVWKLQYTNLFASFQNIDTENGAFAPHTYEGGYRKKFGSFHYLSWNVVPRVQVGLFEGILWQSADSTWKRGFDLNYINPIIFYRPVEFSLGSPDNAILGMNLKIKVVDPLIVYGQFVADDINLKRKDDLAVDSTVTERKDFFQNKTGYQVGFHAFDLFGLQYLDLQGELNTVRPYTYSHKTPQQSYTHFGEALAHPLGANFREWILITDYRRHNWIVSARWIWATYGEDSTAIQHFGKNVFKSDYDSEYGLYSFGNKLLQGKRTQVNNFRFMLSYLVNPTTNMQVFMGWTSRIYIQEAVRTPSSMLTFGLVTSLDNIYDDF